MIQTADGLFPRPPCLGHLEATDGAGEVREVSSDWMSGSGKVSVYPCVSEYVNEHDAVSHGLSVPHPCRSLD